MMNSLVWLKENIEDNQELRDYADWKNWQRQKEDNDERITTELANAKELPKY